MPDASDTFPRAVRPEGAWEGIERYAWDQEGNIVELFVTLDGVEGLPKESVGAMITEWGVELRAKGLEGKNWLFKIDKLNAKIRPDQSVIPGPDTLCFQPPTPQPLTSKPRIVFISLSPTRMWAPHAIRERTTQIRSEKALYFCSHQHACANSFPSSKKPAATALFLNPERCTAVLEGQAGHGALQAPEGQGRRAVARAQV